MTHRGQGVVALKITEAQKQRHTWRFFMPASLWRVSQSSLVLAGSSVPVLPPLIHSPPYPVATINNKKKVDDMSELYISETTIYRPWGKPEPTQYFVSRDTIEDGLTVLGCPVAGPFPTFDEAVSWLKRLDESMTKALEAFAQRKGGGHV